MTNSDLHIVDGDALQFLEPRLITALDAYRDALGVSVSRPETIRQILTDHFIGAGFIPHREDPEMAN